MLRFKVYVNIPRKRPCVKSYSVCQYCDCSERIKKELLMFFTADFSVVYSFGGVDNKILFK